MLIQFSIEKVSDILVSITRPYGQKIEVFDKRGFTQAVCLHPVWGLAHVGLAIQRKSGSVLSCPVAILW